MNQYHDNYLAHYGIKGMRWGHRKNPEVANARSAYKQARKEYNKSYNKAYNYSSRHLVSQFTNAKRKAESDRRWEDADKKADKVIESRTAYKQAKKAYKQTPEGKAQAERTKKAIAAGTAVAGTALAAYGAYKINKFVKEKHVAIEYERGRSWAERTYKATAEVMKNNPNSEAFSGKGNFRAAAERAAARASRDNFRTAAKNVYGEYKRSRY